MRKPDETVLDYIQRASTWLRHSGDFDELPTIESAFELFDLICDTYDVSLMDEMYEAIEEGADPAPLAAFIEKYKLDWYTPWKEEEEVA